MDSAPCPHCGETTRLESWLAGYGTDGDTVEERNHCEWCERQIVAHYKVRLELIEVTAQ